MSAARSRRPAGGALPELTNPLGWQGLRLDLPDTWHPVAFGGDRAQGYLRVDDSYHPRLEVRWRTVSGNPGRAEVVVERLQKALRKRSGRAAPKFYQDPGILQSGDLPDFDVQDFLWESGDQMAWGVATVCPDCRRIVMAQVLGKPGEDHLGLARHILVTLRDHPEADRELWSVFGFQFEVPAGWLLSRSSLRSGFLDFEFRGPKRPKVRLARFAPAEALLAGKGLKLFFGQDLRKIWRRHWTLIESEQAPPADLLCVRGHRDTLLQHLLHRWRPGPHKRDRRWDLWVCQDSNAIYLHEYQQAQGPEARVLGCDLAPGD